MTAFGRLKWKRKCGLSTPDIVRIPCKILLLQKLAYKRPRKELDKN